MCIRDSNITEEQKGDLTVADTQALTLVAMKIGYNKLRPEHVQALIEDKPLHIPLKVSKYVANTLGYTGLVSGSFPMKERTMNKLVDKAKKNYKLNGADYNKSIQILGAGAFD